MKNLMITAVGATAALALAATAAAQRAKDPAPAPPQQQRTMDHSRSMDHDQMMVMMNDAEMRRHMTEMMDSCTQMMRRMGNTPQMKRP